MWPLLALLSVVTVACTPRLPAVQVPEFQVEQVTLRSLTLPGFSGPAMAYLTLQLRVHNPNPYGLRVQRAGGSFFLEGQNVGQVELPDVNLPAGGSALQTADVAIPVTLNTAGQFLRAARGEAVPYRIEGNFTVDAGFLGRPTFGPYVVAQGVLRQPRILP